MKFKRSNSRNEKAISDSYDIRQKREISLPYSFKSPRRHSTTTNDENNEETGEISSRPQKWKTSFKLWRFSQIISTKLVFHLILKF
jgi:hypothetical protein